MRQHVLQSQAMHMCMRILDVCKVFHLVLKHRNNEDSRSDPWNTHSNLSSMREPSAPYTEGGAGPLTAPASWKCARMAKLQKRGSLWARYCKDLTKDRQSTSLGSYKVASSLESSARGPRSGQETSLKSESACHSCGWLDFLYLRQMHSHVAVVN
jgi:hypothetical protein